jgi:hypothetical protein
VLARYLVRVSRAGEPGEEVSGLVIAKGSYSNIEYMEQDKIMIVYESVKKSLSDQLSDVESFNVRAGIVLATCGVVFSAYLQLFSSILEHKITDFHSNELFMAFEILSVLYAGGVSFLSMSPGAENEPWKYSPTPRNLYEKMKACKADEHLIQNELIESMVRAYEYNEKVYEKKFEMLRHARMALFFSGLIFSVHICHLLGMF